MGRYTNHWFFAVHQRLVRINGIFGKKSWKYVGDVWGCGNMMEVVDASSMELKKVS